MRQDLWLTACRSLVEARTHFVVPAGSGHGSSINNDGTPYQIAWATDGHRERIKVIVDPFPARAAEEQRGLVLDRLETWTGAARPPGVQFMDQIAAMGQGENGRARRYWVASDPARTELEIYTALAGETGSERAQELGRLIARLGYGVALPLDHFQLGPISLSAADGILSVYLRPRSHSAIESVVPEKLAGFLEVFAGRSVGARGLLVSYRISPDGGIGFKLDLCGHCVTPTHAAIEEAAEALGARFLGRPIELPANATVAFWGWALAAGRERIHLYCVPAAS